ncbi:MAG: hypothetical protein J6Y37_14710 [Paludibacteraceae bacterium]|nr:hypothetical protein [Paludibacteraceae bacterium]
MDDTYDLDFEDLSHLKVVYVLYIGTDTDNKRVYHFLLSENDNDTFAEGWSEKPACNEKPEALMIDESMFSHVKELKTGVKLELAQDNCCFSMQDCRDKIIALACESLDGVDEYPEPIRIVVHFGDYICDVENMLAKRDMRLRFV